MNEENQQTPDTHAKLVALLQEGGAGFRLLEHVAEGRSADIARIRGNHPGQALKAIVVTLKGGGQGTRNVMAVIPGNRRLDMKGLRKAAGAQKGKFMAPDDATALTGCVMGAVPPFTFWEELALFADPAIRDNDEVCFNAGRLDRSIFMKLDDYVRLADPTFADIAAPEEEAAS